MHEMRDALEEYCRIYRPVAEDTHTDEFDALSEREQLIARYCYEHVEGYGRGCNLESLEWAANDLAEIYGIEKPEDLCKYAATCLKFRYAKLNDEQWHAGWTDAMSTRVANCERQYHLLISGE